MNWKAGLMILVTLALIVLAQPRLSVYSVEEALAVVLGVAVGVVFVLLPVIAFLFLWQGARFVFVRLKGMVVRITSIRDRRPPATQAMNHLFPGH